MNTTIRVPKRVQLITSALDINKRGGAYEHVGWAPDYESYGLEYGFINEDPEKPLFWEQVDELLYLRRFDCGKGDQMRSRKIAIDTGYLAGRVYAYVSGRAAGEEFSRAYHVIAVKGESRGLNEPFLFSLPPKHTQGNPGALLLRLNVDHGKADVIYRFDKITEPGPGYCFFPSENGRPANGYGLQYEGELKAEELVDTSKGGSHAKRWGKTSSHIRNEALDCRVYATAAMEYSRFNFGSLRRDLIRKDRNEGPQFGARQMETPDNIERVRINKLRAHDLYAYGAHRAIKLPGSVSGFGAINWPLFPNE